MNRHGILSVVCFKSDVLSRKIYSKIWLNIPRFYPSLLIGRCGPYPKASYACQACSRNFTTTEKVVNQHSDRGMDHTSIINFLSNEDTGKQACFELAPGFFIKSDFSVQLKTGVNL
jgi:hypothetical protein